MMGADYPGQERAIEELSNLSQEAKKFLCHHINNSLSVVIGGLESGRTDLAYQAAYHIKDDLVLAGIDASAGIALAVSRTKAEVSRL